MDAFEAGAGISAENLSYIIAPTLVVMTVIIVALGLIEALRVARYADGGADLYVRLGKGLAAIILMVTFVYYVTKH